MQLKLIKFCIYVCDLSTKPFYLLTYLISDIPASSVSWVHSSSTPSNWRVADRFFNKPNCLLVKSLSV